MTTLSKLLAQSAVNDTLRTLVKCGLHSSRESLPHVPCSTLIKLIQDDNSLKYNLNRVSIWSCNVLQIRRRRSALCDPCPFT